ncbi:MAG: hypothetical protein J6Y33_07305 [Prevotella sp.]|nr:hypothetical protein [Prevotella sp.]
MKKLFSFIFATAVVVLLSVSCRHKIEHGETSGLVDEINDTSMIVKIDGSKVKFDISVASFTHGAVMYGDSVIVHYVGDLSMKRALAETVYLIDRPSRIVIIDRNEPIDTTDKTPLLTRPADPDKVENDRRGVNAAKYYAK